MLEEFKESEENSKRFTLDDIWTILEEFMEEKGDIVMKKSSNKIINHIRNSTSSVS